jgi:excisionase family DNA binding protein
MVTVLEAARLVGRDPETIRRWIRVGKLKARKIGLQHMIEEEDLPVEQTPSLPQQWRRTATGEPMPDVVTALERARAGR